MLEVIRIRRQTYDTDSKRFQSVWNPVSLGTATSPVSSSGEKETRERARDVPGERRSAGAACRKCGTRCRATDFIVAGKLRVIGVVINDPPSYIRR